MALSIYKTGLIIKREYLSRVRNKTFLLTTFLFPLFLMLLLFGSAMLSPDTTEKIAPQKATVDLNANIGLACGTLIYITIFIFGTMVMRGVKEEKVNRIAEIIISSVKPFELMIGKILGIASVALTQLFLWFALIALLLTASSVFLSHDVVQQAQQASQAMHGNNSASLVLKLNDAKQTISGINYWGIMFGFAFYFLGGFLFYAALFAAVGSAINEDSQDTQSFTLPISIPIIFSFIILTSNLATPNNKIMVWASIIPFSSPIVMMGRIAGGVPVWQLLLSMVSLITGFLLTTWVAAKIYRTGILMYGKKSSWKEMLKWAFRKS